MLKPAPLMRRFLALMYESLLVLAITVLVNVLSSIFKTLIDHQFPQLSILITPISAVLILWAWWGYFRLNWLKGQTLPMRVWKIQLTNRLGARPDIRLLRLRFLWASVFLALIPAIAYIFFKNMGLPPKTAFITALFWWILPWGFAWFHPQRQFLYDHLAGTFLQDQRG